MKISCGTIGYKLPLSKKTIEIPIKHRNKAIAIACANTLEAGAGVVLTLGGIAMKDPAFSGVGLAILGKVAGTVAMLKGSIWDFAGKFQKNAMEKLSPKLKDEIGKQLEKI